MLFCVQKGCDVLRKRDQIELALLEYQRDPDFKALADQAVCHLLESNQVPVGSALETILELETEGGELLAKRLLREYHDQSSHQQWRRALDLARGVS